MRQFFRSFVFRNRHDSVRRGKHSRRTRNRSLERLEPRHFLAGDVVISELMASNNGSLADEDADYSDWLELHNTSAAAIGLDGYFLTDDENELTKWRLPAVTLQPDAYLLIFASGKNRANPSATLHTNFALGREGEFLGLVRPDGTTIEHAYAPEFPEQLANVSYGLFGTNLATPQYFTTATPRRANVAGAFGVVGDTKFSVDRGFFTAPFEVEITTASAAAEIRYTLDGTAPTASSGLVYDRPIQVATTTTLRAAAFQPGYVSSNVDTQTYIFLADVIRQDGTGLPRTANWGHAGPDYEMDPQIVEDPRYADTITSDLQSIPSISLVTDWNNWFGAGGPGIYIQGSGSQRAVSAELIHADGARGFQIDASVQVQGGSSTDRWKSDKLSLRLKFTAEYGPTKLEYPLFGAGATDRFDTIILDAVLNYSWLHNTDADQRNRAKYIQDQFVADLQNAVGGFAPHGTFAHLYLNGLYWGLYYVHERPDESFAAAYLGGDKDDYDVMKHTAGEVVSGTTASYRALLNAARADLRVAENYAAIEALLDVDDFIDYMIVNFYTGNDDWAHHNWYATYNRVDAGGRWRFHSWDAEHVLKNVNQDVTGKDDSGSPTYIHQRLATNATYRLKFADHVQRHFFGHGPLTPANAAAAYQARMDEVSRAIVGESARWGDNRVTRPFTRDHWHVTQNDLLQNYFPRRTAVVLAQLKARGLYPATDAPSLGHFGGEVEAGYELTIRTMTGTVHYTLDGSDPRLADGSISPVAVAIAPRAVGTVRIHEPLVVRARSFAGGQWSALAEAEFFVRGGGQHLVGDFNASGRVEQADLDLVLLHWGRAGEDVPSGWTGGPAVGPIDQDELDAVLLNWGAELAAATAVPAVPSPLQESVDPLSRWRGRVAVGAGGDELSKGRRAAAQPINSTTGAPPFAKDFALAELAHRRGLQSAVARQ